MRENLRKQEVHEETAGPGPTFRKEERKGILEQLDLRPRTAETTNSVTVESTERQQLVSITIFFPYRPPARRRGRRQYASVRQAPADKAGGRYGKKMAGEEGFEPSNAGIKIRCLNQLGDSPTGGLNGPMLQWVFFKTGTYYHRSDRICCHTRSRDCSLNFDS